VIHPKEINKHASHYKVSDRQIEKDYVLTWALYGIANHELLSKALVFKGGTVLKKFYFEGYRFSEDLDFTLLNESLTHENLKENLVEVFAWIKEESNLTLQHKDDAVHQESGSSLFYINHSGPLAANIESRDIKIDITRGEKMEFAPVHKKAVITYTDLPKDSFILQCYSLSEIVIEKMTALMGRTEPRDLYDFWYLMEVERLNMADHHIEFTNKATHKGHRPELFGEKVLKKEKAFERDWIKKLGNQIHDLPEYNGVFRGIKRYLK
jgi:uncharacterized protein